MVRPCLFACSGSLRPALIEQRSRRVGLLLGESAHVLAILTALSNGFSARRIETALNILIEASTGTCKGLAAFFCDIALFHSDTNSIATGWPSFWQPLAKRMFESLRPFHWGWEAPPSHAVRSVRLSILVTFLILNTPMLGSEKTRAAIELQWTQMPKAPAMAIDEVSVLCLGPLPPGNHLTRSDSVCKPLSATQLWIIFDLGTNDVLKSRVNVNVNGVRAQWGPLHLERALRSAHQLVNDDR